MLAGLSCFLSSEDGYVRELLELQQGGEVPGASVRNPARDKVMRKEADIRKACSDFRDPSGNS